MPAGLRRCTLFVPKRSGRESRVVCWAPDNMTFTRLAELVTDALGDRGSIDEDGRIWKVGEVEILAEREDKTITVRRR